MKKTSTRLLALSASGLMFAVSGCGSDGGSGGDSDDITIAGVSILVGDPYFVALKCGAQKAADDLGVELLWDGSTSPDVAPQAEIFSAMQLKQPDGYVFTPFSQDAFLATVKTVMSQGAPVVLADATMADHVYYQGVQSDNEEAGQMVADYIAESAAEAGTIAIIANGPAQPIDEARYEGLADRVSAANSEIEVLDPEYANGSSSEAAKVASGLIQAHSDLQLIYATNGPQATGAASAIRASGKEGEIGLVAYAGEAEQIQALRNGQIDALLSQSPYLIGQKAVEITTQYIKDHADGGAVEPADEQTVYTPTMLITSDNVDSDEAKPYVDAPSC